MTVQAAVQYHPLSSRIHLSVSTGLPGQDIVLSAIDSVSAVEGGRLHCLSPTQQQEEQQEKPVWPSLECRFSAILHTILLIYICVCRKRGGGGIFLI